MPLGVYEKVAEGRYVEYSTNGDQTRPITTVHHGRNGNTFEMKLFLKADDDHEYENISIKPTTKTSDDDIGLGSNTGTSGWGVKVMADPGYAPTENDWDAIEYGTALDFPSTTVISGSGTVLPFWYKIVSPRGINIGTKNNIALKLLYTDNGTP